LSETVKAKANVLFYDKEKPDMGRGAAGQLVLTDRRLMYVRYLWKSMRALVKDYADTLDEGLANKGSIEIPLGQILEARAERRWGTPYLKIRYQISTREESCAFVFTTSLWMIAGGVDVRKSTAERLASTIEQLKKRI